MMTIHIVDMVNTFFMTFFLKIHFIDSILYIIRVAKNGLFSQQKIIILFS